MVTRVVAEAGRGCAEAVLRLAEASQGWPRLEAALGLIRTQLAETRLAS